MGGYAHPPGGKVVRRLFIRGKLAPEIRIDGSDAHHLMHVLRAKSGQVFTLVDAAGHTGEAEITGFTEENVRMHLLRELSADTESPLELCLAQCLPKADKMDFIVQKAVELGVSCVQPLRSTNCVVKYDKAKAAARVQKWQRIADEAAKQCGRTRKLQVAGIQELSVWVKQIVAEGMPLLFCYEKESHGIREYLQQSSDTRYAVLIGPEGGFTPQEAELLLAAHASSVSLGPRILRAETAAVAALSIVQYEKGDLGA